MQRKKTDSRRYLCISLTGPGSWNSPANSEVALSYIPHSPPSLIFSSMMSQVTGRSRFKEIVAQLKAAIRPVMCSAFCNSCGKE